MSGSGPAGELTFADVRSRLAQVVGRVAEVHAEADRAALEAITTQSVAPVTGDIGGSK